MSDEYEFLSINSNTADAVGKAAEAGVDLLHLFEHLYSTALCTLGSEESFDAGFFVQLTDLKARQWTFSIIPEDGGLVSDGLLKMALEGDNP